MISLEQLHRHYDMEKGTTIFERPGIKVVKRARKTQRIDDKARYQHVVIKTNESIPIRTSDASVLIDDLGRMMNGALTYYQAQSDLAVSLEGMCLVPSNIPGQSGFLFVDQIMVMEYFGEDLNQLIQTNRRLSESEVDKFIGFIIRALRMLKQRGIIHGDIKPANIVYDEDLNFKLIDFDGSGFYRSDTTITKKEYTPDYASRLIKQKLMDDEPITAEDWRANDSHCAALTILQVIFQLNYFNFREYLMNKFARLPELINKVPVDFPNIGERLREVIIRLIKGEDIEAITTIYDENSLVLRRENFRLVRDIKLEDSVIDLTKSKSMTEEMRDIVKMLVKSVDLSNIKTAISSLPEALGVQGNDQDRQIVSPINLLTHQMESESVRPIQESITNHQAPPFTEIKPTLEVQRFQFESSFDSTLLNEMRKTEFEVSTMKSVEITWNGLARGESSSLTEECKEAMTELNRFGPLMSLTLKILG
eukprot:TRINITY_DN3221_c0_g2_i2.p1 TRINITY_DN3221_c0_g2~~TRINITY_DN3221_c0_g2_i2.p1  ORF type:complete len:479 (+),score=61.79 TRINITY_DN3221_c0_g2_i2:50-1486(+)